MIRAHLLLALAASLTTVLGATAATPPRQQDSPSADQVAVGSTSERSLEQCVAEFHKRVAIQTARASQVKALLDIARVHTDAATDALLKIHSSCHASLKENVLYALSLCQAPSAHEALLKFAKGKDRDNRLQAARSLLLRKREDQLWLRDKRLKSERDPEIRGFLLRALLDADIPDLDRICLRDAKSKHTAIAIAGVYGIGKLRLEKGIKIVKKHLSQAKPRLRAASFQALASLGGKDSFLLLIEALGNPRNTAEFPQIIGALCAADESEELNVLIRTGLRAKDEWVVSGAIQGIAAAAAHLPEICGPALLGMLTHKSAEIRTAAIEGLVAARPAGAIEALGRRLRHPDQKTRTDALWALAKIGNLPSNIMGKIVALTTDKSIAMRIQSTLAMQWFNDDSALKAAIARLQDESWAVRSAAAEALLEIRRLESVLPLLNAFTAESGRVADELYETLCQLTGEDFGPALGAWRNWYSDQKLGYALPAADVSAERLKTRRERRAKSGGSTASYHGIPIPRGGVVFILDSSGSMNNSYSAKQTYYEYFSSLLSETIQHLPGSTRFNVIFFESGVRVWQENLQEATKVNIALAREFLSDNLPGGGTNIYDSLMAALNMDGVQTIFFMTDGDPTAGRYQTRNEIFSRFRRANRDKRIVLNTIAAGKVSAEFLASLAASNGGKSVDLTDLAKKTKAKEDQP